MYENFNKLRITSVHALPELIAGVQARIDNLKAALITIKGDGGDVAGTLADMVTEANTYADNVFANIDLSKVEANRLAIEEINAKIDEVFSALPKDDEGGKPISDTLYNSLMIDAVDLQMRIDMTAGSVIPLGSTSTTYLTLKEEDGVKSVECNNASLAINMAYPLEVEGSWTEFENFTQGLYVAGQTNPVPIFISPEDFSISPKFLLFSYFGTTVKQLRIVSADYINKVKTVTTYADSLGKYLVDSRTLDGARDNAYITLTTSPAYGDFVQLDWSNSDWDVVDGRYSTLFISNLEDDVELGRDIYEIADAEWIQYTEDGWVMATAPDSVESVVSTTIAGAVNKLLDNAEEALDTIKELADQTIDNEQDLTDLRAQVDANKLELEACCADLLSRVVSGDADYTAKLTEFQDMIDAIPMYVAEMVNVPNLPYFPLDVTEDKWVISDVVEGEGLTPQGTARANLGLVSEPEAELLVKAEMGVWKRESHTVEAGVITLTDVPITQIRTIRLYSADGVSFDELKIIAGTNPFEYQVFATETGDLDGLIVEAHYFTFVKP